LTPASEKYSRQLMTIYQLRSDMGNDIGNKAVIEGISKKRIAVVFETDELKEKILHSDSNPVKQAFLVDVEVQTVNEKIAAYKVLSLHDIIELE
jgi:CRISPR/Cas system-associated protein Cas5 (RAMP superfamily)